MFDASAAGHMANWSCAVQAHPGGTRVLRESSLVQVELSTAGTSNGTADHPSSVPFDGNTMEGPPIYHQAQVRWQPRKLVPRRSGKWKALVMQALQQAVIRVAEPRWIWRKPLWT